MESEREREGMESDRCVSIRPRKAMRKLLLKTDGRERQDLVKSRLGVDILVTCGVPTGYTQTWTQISREIDCINT